MSKLLLVDDEPKVLRALSAALELDHDIFTAQSATEAKQVIGCSGPFDAVITDEVMPGTKGHDLLDWCRRKMPKSKRIMLTGLPITAELKAKCGSASDASILSKPWNLAEIEQALSAEESSELFALTDEQPKILVLDNTGRSRDTYQQVASQLKSGILITGSAEGLVTQLYADQSTEKVVLNIEDDDDMEALLKLVLAIRKANPAVHIIIATPAKLVRATSEIEARSKFVKILVKPFLYKRLVCCLSSPALQN